jgi:hypothetical protein
VSGSSASMARIDPPIINPGIWVLACSTPGGLILKIAVAWFESGPVWFRCRPLSISPDGLRSLLV